MVRVCVERDNCGIREETGDLVLCSIRVKNFAIDARQTILLKTADGLRRSQNRPPNASFVEPHEGAIPFLDFDNAILDSHRRSIGQESKKLRNFSHLYLSKWFSSDTVTLG